MRLGLLGPDAGKGDTLARAAKRLLGELGADRIVYLGVDGALDEVVRQWAEQLVGQDPTNAGVWLRAARECVSATPAEIDAFIAAERERQRLRTLESLPDDHTRVVEMIAGHVAVMVHDQRSLTEDDMLPARLLLFGKGKSEKPIIKQVGQRWFLSPGNQAEGGALVLDDSAEALTATIYDGAGQELRRETLTLSRATKLTVGGARV